MKEPSRVGGGAAVAAILALAISTCAVAGISATSVQRFEINYATMGVATVQSECFAELIDAADGSLMYVPLRTLLNCFRQTPVNATTAFAIAEFAQLAWETYSLRHDLPTEFGPIADQFRSLLALFNDTSATGGKSMHFDISEFDFHALVARLFLHARDRHLIYLAPPTFRSTSTIFPMSFGSRVNAATGAQEVFVRGWAPTWVNEGRHFLSDHPYFFPGGHDALMALEAEVTALLEESRAANSNSSIAIATVNGVPGAEWALDLSEGVAMADPHATFNSGLSNDFRVPLPFLSPYTLHLHNASFNLDLPTPIVSPNVPPGASTDTIEDVFVFTNGRRLVVPKMLRSFTSMPKPECVGVASDAAAAAAATAGAPWVRALHHLAVDRYPDVSATERRDLLAADAMRPVAAANTAQREARHVRGEVQRRRRAEALLRAVSPTATLDRFLSFRDLSTTGYLVFGKAGERFAWLRVPTFLPSEELTVVSILQYSERVGRFMDEAAAAGITRLIVDVSGNGGGYVALSDFLAQTLFPQFRYTSTPTGPLSNRSVRVTDFGEQQRLPLWMPISRRAAFGDVAGLSPVPASDSVVSGAHVERRLGREWFDDVLNETWDGSVPALYPFYQPGAPDSERWWIAGQASAPYARASSPLTDLVSPLFDSILGLGPQRPRAAVFTNITILTDGRCGSACGMFVWRTRKWVPGVRVVTYGGMKARDTGGTRPQAFQFIGGRVLTFACPTESKRRVLAFQGTFPFPGRFDMFDVGDFVSVDMTYNAYHVVDRGDAPAASSTPVQMTNNAGDEHWWMWEPTFNDVVQQLYPGFEPGEWQPPSSSGGSGCRVCPTPLRQGALVMALLLLLALCGPALS